MDLGDFDKPYAPLFWTKSPVGTLFFAVVHMNWDAPPGKEGYAHEVEVAISRADYLAAVAFFGLGVPRTELPGVVGYVVTEETTDGDLPTDCLGRRVDICFNIPEEGMNHADAVFADEARATS